MWNKTDKYFSFVVLTGVIIAIIELSWVQIQQIPSGCDLNMQNFRQIFLYFAALGM